MPLNIDYHLIGENGESFLHLKKKVIPVMQGTHCGHTDAEACTRFITTQPSAPAAFVKLLFTFLESVRNYNFSMRMEEIEASNCP